jgi:hypothetical protein
MVPGVHYLGVRMKKQMKKLLLAKETLRGLEKLDGLGYVAGGGPTVVSGCTCSCCTCAVTACQTDPTEQTVPTM